MIFVFCRIGLSRQGQLHIRVFHKLIPLNSANSINHENIQNGIVTRGITHLATNTSSVMLTQNNFINITVTETTIISFQYLTND